MKKRRISKDLRQLMGDIETCLGLEVRLKHGGKHCQLLLSRSGLHIGTLYCSYTPGCHRSRKNELAMARRLASK